MARPRAQPATNPRLELVPIALIDEPELPVRTTIDPTGIEELAGSYRAVGPLQPLLVVVEGERRRVMAGHRRLLAGRAAGLGQLICLVYQPGTISAEAALAHENAYREQPNPVEEARWLSTLCERDCGSNVDRLCELVRQKRAYVEERLLLLSGDAEVCAAVERGEIPMAVAAQLNRYTDPGLRRMRLQAAAAGGATARNVRDWRRQDELLLGAITSAGPAAAAGAPPSTPVMESALVCSICHQGDQPHRLRLRYAHDFCEEAERRFLASSGGAPAAAPLVRDGG